MNPTEKIFDGEFRFDDILETASNMIEDDDYRIIHKMMDEAENRDYPHSTHSYTKEDIARIVASNRFRWTD